MLHSVEQSDTQTDRMTLSTLPYDLLLNVAQHLDLSDIYTLQITCKSLHDFATTRPVFRNAAVALLRRCRALPLAGFQRLQDLSTEQLVDAVTKATRLEEAWLTRAPRPSLSSLYTADLAERKWFKIISAPPNEEVDWLSPITSSYSLCATKSGKVVCWDVHRDVCLAEWDPKERWELWKCRVEFEIRTVFFTMAKVLHKPFDDRLMEFVLMKLQFPEVPGEETPVFTHLATFKTIGIVMNVFLLDPSSRLLSAFVWVSASNTIGLYALLDWDKEEYVFIDTSIECSMSSNWSCILYEQQIIIHSEDSDVAYQYSYPISLLQEHARPTTPAATFVPRLSSRVSPATTMSAPFTFPSPAPSTPSSSGDTAIDTEPTTDSSTSSHTTSTAVGNNNPFPFPPWYPESAHFVRQWWPTLPTVPRLSCTVVLLADHDPITHHTRYILAQHYFRVPLVDPCEVHKLADGGSMLATEDDAIMRIWYVNEPFEVVCVVDGVDEDDDDDDEETGSDRPRPLMAVDFGHAVWVEYINPGEEQDDQKQLRFVSFPPVARDAVDWTGNRKTLGWEGESMVRTLQIPPELDLDTVETINIDQSQGAVIISVREGKIFILCYE